MEIGNRILAHRGADKDFLKNTKALPAKIRCSLIIASKTEIRVNKRGAGLYGLVIRTDF
jgi:hypothetical protein